MARLDGVRLFLFSPLDIKKIFLHSPEEYVELEAVKLHMLFDVLKRAGMPIDKQKDPVDRLYTFGSALAYTYHQEKKAENTSKHNDRKDRNDI